MTQALLRFDIVNLFLITLRDNSVISARNLRKHTRFSSVSLNDFMLSVRTDSSVFKRAKKILNKDKEKLSESIEVDSLKICKQDIFKTYISS